MRARIIFGFSFLFYRASFGQFDIQSSPAWRVVAPISSTTIHIISFLVRKENETIAPGMAGAGISEFSRF